MAVTYESYTSGADSAWVIAENYLVGQTFTPSVSHTIDKVRIKLFRVGSPGTLTVSIYATSGGVPTDGALATGTTNGNTLTTNTFGAFRDITLGAGASLSSGTMYAIVAEAADGTLYSDEVYWKLDSSSPTYTGGTGVRIPTWPGFVFVWETVPGWDCMFIEYGPDVGPTKPTNPTPANDATEVDFSAFGLSWEDGGGADTYDVYIGVSGSPALVSIEQVGTSYTTALEELEIIFETSPIDQVIYWRIDATNSEGTTTGDEWNFDARPTKVTDPIPDDDATLISLGSTTTQWTIGSENTTSYDAYFGTESGSLDVVGEDFEDLEYELSSDSFNYYTPYYWRVDAKNQFGIAVGDEWSFTTLLFYPPLPHYTLILVDGPDFTYGDGINYGGTEGTDWYWDGYNFIRASRKLVAVAKNTIFYEQYT